MCRIVSVQKNRRALLNVQIEYTLPIIYVTVRYTIYIFLICHVSIARMIVRYIDSQRAHIMFGFSLFLFKTRNMCIMVPAVVCLYVSARAYINIAYSTTASSGRAVVRNHVTHSCVSSQ